MTEEKLDAVHSKHETSPRKFLKRLPQAMIVGKSSAQRTTKLLKLGPRKTLVVAAVKKHDRVAGIHSGGTKKQYAQRGFNSFWRRPPESKQE
jgi:hypothetical protein